MQEVYNKTMAMLFRGTKNLANNNAGIEMEELEEEAQSKDTVISSIQTQFPLSNLIVLGRLQAAIIKRVWSPHLLIIQYLSEISFSTNVAMNC